MEIPYFELFIKIAMGILLVFGCVFGMILIKIIEMII